MLVRMNSSDMTPLDVAGSHNSHEAAYLIIDYFFQRFQYVEEVFNVKPGDLISPREKEPYFLKYQYFKKIT